MPSQLFEHFLHDISFLQQWAIHNKSNEPMNKDLLHHIYRSKNIFIGVDTMEQCFRALYDQYLYGIHNGGGDVIDSASVLQDVSQKYALIPHSSHSLWHATQTHF